MRSTMCAAIGAALALALPATAAPSDRLVGGGSIDNPNLRVTLGMSLPCTSTDPGTELEINWFNPQPDPPGRESFHLTAMDGAACDAGSPAPNDGGSHEGSGMGICRTSAGVTVAADVDWSFSDSGVQDPNLRRADTVDVTIRSAVPECSLTFSGPLADGNLKLVDNSNI
jgi:hypothetical protein